LTDGGNGSRISVNGGLKHFNSPPNVIAPQLPPLAVVAD
jgi:hypothetical protein